MDRRSLKYWMREADWEDVGRRVAAYRHDLGLSQRRLAQISGIDRGTISRLERGGRCFAEPLCRIAEAMSVSILSLLRPVEHFDATYRVHRGTPEQWVPDRRSPIRLRQLYQPGTPLGPDERQRLGQNKLVDAFVMEVDCELSGGRLRGYFAELYAPLEPEMTSYPGEEWLFVLQGSIRFTIAGDQIVLHAGQAISLRADIPHDYCVVSDGDTRLRPAQVLAIRIATACDHKDRDPEREKSPKAKK